MRHSKKLAALAIAAGVAITASAAFAYWSTGGSGSGSASAAAGFPAGNVEVNQNDVSEFEAMYPGGPVQSLTGNFTNDNTGGIWVTSLNAVIKKADGTDWVIGSGSETCSAADFRIGSDANPGVLTVTANEVDAGEAEGAWNGTIRMLNRPGVDQDACKNAVPPIQYTAS